MGCDVHLHQEVKIKGKWEHYRETSIPRDYEVFAKMAGVRGDTPPIASPRGLPKDMTGLTRFSAEYDGIDGHTHSWLGATEIAELEKFIETRLGDSHWRLEIDGWGYFFGNSWGSFLKSPPKGIQDIRFIFWFDN